MSEMWNFVKANRKSRVVEGAVLSHTERGAAYRLENGQEFRLSREECAALPDGFPRWKGIGK